MFLVLLYLWEVLHSNSKESILLEYTTVYTLVKCSFNWSLVLDYYLEVPFSRFNDFVPLRGTVHTCPLRSVQRLLLLIHYFDVPLSSLSYFLVLEGNSWWTLKTSFYIDSLGVLIVSSTVV